MDERYEKIVKDEANFTSVNCPGLSSVKTNILIWVTVSHKARVIDKTFQTTEASVVSAGTCYGSYDPARVRRERYLFDNLFVIK